MLIGIIFALFAGLFWGLIFIFPLLIPEYPGILQAIARYVAFGIISLLISFYKINKLKKLLIKDWIEALKLVFIGNLVYYTCLTNAIQRTGSLISTMIIGILPIAISVGANTKCGSNDNRTIPWSFLFIGLLLILSGLVIVNIDELKLIKEDIFNFWHYSSGIFLAVISVLCWTWYALRNARWLRKHPYDKPNTWAIAQGVITLPLSIFSYFIICIIFKLSHNNFILPFGPRPCFFLLLMVIMGFFCSWLGTLCWNEACQRLPAILIGPMIIFETIFGLFYTFLQRNTFPSYLTITGILCLIVGIIYMACIKHIDYHRKI